MRIFHRADFRLECQIQKGENMAKLVLNFDVTQPGSSDLAARSPRFRRATNVWCGETEDAPARRASSGRGARARPLEMRFPRVPAAARYGSSAAVDASDDVARGRRSGLPRAPPDVPPFFDRPRVSPKSVGGGPRGPLVTSFHKRLKSAFSTSRVVGGRRSKLVDAIRDRTSGDHGHGGPLKGGMSSQGFR